MTDALTVNQALAAVMAELPGIGKDAQASAQQGGYAYRGIEAITRHAQPLFAKHGVVTVPQVQSIDVRELTVNNKPWTDTTLVVEYTIVGPDGSQLTATCVGVGRDNSDKGANKAMTQAYKYMLLQVLCISDSNDDADGTTVAADAIERRTKARDEMMDGFVRLTDQLGIGDPDSRAAFVEACLGRTAKWSALSFAEKSLLVEALEAVDSGESVLAKDNAGRPYVVPESEPFDVPAGEQSDADPAQQIVGVVEAPDREAGGGAPPAGSSTTPADLEERIAAAKQRRAAK